LSRDKILTKNILNFPSISPPPFDACLREAASAKAGGRVPAAPGERVAAGSGSAPEGLLPRGESLWLGEGWTKGI